MGRRFGQIEFGLLIALVAMGFILFNWPLIAVASDNSRLVGAFNPDEERDVRLVMGAISQRTLKLDFTTFGHLHLNTALLPLLALSHFVTVSEQMVIIALRTVATLSAIATVAATFILARRYFGRFAAWISAFILSTVPHLVIISSWSRPDTLQLLFIVSGIYFCCRMSEQHRWRWLALASASAGLAFSSKYSGVFLLPVIWFVFVARCLRGEGAGDVVISPVQFARIMRFVAAGLGIGAVAFGAVVTPSQVAPLIISNETPEKMEWFAVLFNTSRAVGIVTGSILLVSTIPRLLWSALSRATVVSASLAGILVSFAVFLAAFVVTSPYSVWRLNFLKGIHEATQVTAFGHVFQDTNSGLRWFQVLSAPSLLGGAVTVLAMLGLIIAVSHKYSGLDRGRWLRAELVVSLWVLLYLGFLVLRVNLRPPQYLFPIIPSIVVLATLPLSVVVIEARKRLSRRVCMGIAIVLALGVGAPQLSNSVHRLQGYREVVLSREYSTTVYMGHWLAEQYGPATRILYDQYSYVPPQFSDVQATFGGTIGGLEAFEPEVVIVNSAISGRFTDLRRAAMYSGGESAFRERYEYYEALRTGTIGFDLDRDFGSIQVYHRRVGTDRSAK